MLNERRIVVLLLIVHAILVGVCAVRYSFAWTESAMLAAGILEWQHGAFEIFRVNPPLVRMWATLPLFASGVEAPYESLMSDVRDRPEWPTGRAFVEMHGESALNYLIVARLMCLPLTLLGGWIAYRWSRELFGACAGVGALLLWTFMPMIVGFGSLISGDSQAAVMGMVTLYLFRDWLRSPSGYGSLMLGLFMGLTVLTKLSWVILFGLLPALWGIVRSVEWLGVRAEQKATLSSHGQAGAGWRSGTRELAAMAMVLGTSLLTISLLYGFDGSLKRLESYRFISRALSQEDDREWRSHRYHGNRLAGTWLGKLPVPFPEDMVLGADLQKWDFDRERWSYFRSQWRTEGWWYYYLYGLAIKVPIGAWVLMIIAACGFFVCKSWRADWRDELVLLVPAMLVLALASAETGLNRHLRYVLPIFPPVIVLTSRAFLAFRSSSSLLRFSVTLASAAFVVSSLWSYPHSISYFNELIGGPRHGIQYMESSNVDWGQDVGYLKRWCERHPEARPLYATYEVSVAPLESLGVPMAGPVPMLRPEIPRSKPLPAGWYAIDHQSLLGHPKLPSGYEYLKTLEPVARVGYGFLIFRMDESLAGQLVDRERALHADRR